MEQFQTVNCLLASAVINNAAAALLPRTTVSVSAKANGEVFTVSAANLPALTTAEKSDGSIAGTLADGYSRIYTFLATLNPETGVVTKSIVSSEDFATRNMKMSDINYGNVAIVNSFGTQLDNTVVIGFLKIDTAGAAFVPGTTALDAGTVTTRYINAFGFVGQ
jgi:hypothetical protein